MDQKICVQFQNIHNCSAQKLLEATHKNIDKCPVCEPCASAAQPCPPLKHLHWNVSLHHQIVLAKVTGFSVIRFLYGSPYSAI